MTKQKDPLASTLHRDGTVTLWDVYQQQWVRLRHPSDRVYASIGSDERARIKRHIERHAR